MKQKDIAGAKKKGFSSKNNMSQGADDKIITKLTPHLIPIIFTNGSSSEDFETIIVRNKNVEEYLREGMAYLSQKHSKCMRIIGLEKNIPKAITVTEKIKKELINSPIDTQN